MKKIIEVAEVILVNSEGKALLQLRDNKVGIFGARKWRFIGGSKGKDESFDECIIREIKEELGININNLELIDVIDDENENIFFKHQIFFGVIDTNPCDIKLKEGKEVKFFAIDEIQNIATVPWFQKIYSNSIKKLKAV